MSQPIVMRQFGGIRPRTPAALLSDPDGTTSQNCDHAYGELRNANDGFQVSQLAIASQSIYTEDGLLFYSWPGDVDAARSPIAQDPHDRLYYTTGTMFAVTNRDDMLPFGGGPMVNWLVGVPRPTVAPTLAVTAAPTPDNQNWQCVFFYESAGTKYQATNVTLTATTLDASSSSGTTNAWTFTIPDMASGTPATAVPQVELIGINSTTNAQEFDEYSSSSSFVGTLQNAADWAVTLTISGTTGTVDLAPSAQQGANQETVAYTYTYVNAYGEEGPPADPALATHEIGYEIDVTITLDESVLTAGYMQITEIRVYRTPSGSTVASYFYVGSIYPNYSSPSGPQYTFNDTVASGDLGEELSSTNYYPPPQNLVGLNSLPNGILYGWVDNALYFSNAYQPWAWNPANVLTFPNRIVGSLPMGEGLVMSTTAKPYVIAGSTPDAMSAAPLNISLAGVSKWSFANVGGLAMFATQEGIVVIEGAMGSMGYSDRFFTRDVWRQKYQAGFAQMRFAEWDGRLVVWAADGSFTPFMLRFEGMSGTMTELPNFNGAGSFINPLNDSFYYTNGKSVLQFNTGVPLQSSWQSRIIIQQGPANYGAFEAMCDGEWVLTIYADDENGVMVKRFQTTLTGNVRDRLPSGYKSRRWQIALQGVGTFRELRIADSMRDLGVI